MSIIPESVVPIDAINVNWLLNQILGAGKTKYQITKITNEQVLTFIKVLVDNPFNMPDGSDALHWVRERLALRYDQAQNKMSRQWEDTRVRYKWIIQQIDIMSIKRNKIELEQQSIQNPKEFKNELSVSFGEF